MSTWNERGNVVNWKGPYPPGPLSEDDMTIDFSIRDDPARVRFSWPDALAVVSVVAIVATAIFVATRLL